MKPWSVKWYSQYQVFHREDYGPRGCGIVALRSVMQFWHPALGLISFDDLFTTGVEIGAYLPTIGWKHYGLVQLAQQHGLTGFNADWAPQSRTPRTRDEAFDLLVSELKHGPVIASVWTRFDPATKSGHLVVVTGVDDTTVTMNDPDGRTEAEGVRIMPVRDFLNAYRQRYICIRPVAGVEKVSKNS